MGIPFLKFGVVGAGHMGTYHLKKIIEKGSRFGTRATVVVEPDEQRRKIIKRDLSLPPDFIFVSNLGELDKIPIELKPDALVVAVPASLHVSVATACLRKGYHTFVEKPLGFSSREFHTTAE